jgi:hypothetical protein
MVEGIEYFVTVSLLLSILVGPDAIKALQLWHRQDFSKVPVGEEFLAIAFNIVAREIIDPSHQKLYGVTHWEEYYLQYPN